MSDNKAIINYLEKLIEEQNILIKKNLEDYPEDKNTNTFCYECGYHTEDMNYHEKYIKDFLEWELRKIENKQ